MSDRPRCGAADCQPGFEGGPNGDPSPDLKNTPPRSSYGVSTKVMVVAVAVFVGVVVFIYCLRVYAKWFLRNHSVVVATDGSRTLSWRRRRYRRNPRVHNPSAGQVMVQGVGLEKSVVEALPTFEFNGEEMKKHGVECTVCLEEFKEGDKGRSLPKCSHAFHLDCIDMWLYSHSTCPLCRANVLPGEDEKGTGQSEATVVAIEEQPHRETIVGDVQAPFLAAVRASRRQQQNRGQLPSLNSSAVGNSHSHSLPRTGDGQNPHNNDAAESPIPSTDCQQESKETPAIIAASVDQKVLVKDYETPVEVPLNVLCWGNETQGVQGSAELPRSTSIGAPFQVSIDIPRSDPAAAVTDPANVMSPMARASASFRRLLSRGKNVVSPSEDVDEGRPSTSPRPPPPPPPPNA